MLYFRYEKEHKFSLSPPRFSPPPPFPDQFYEVSMVAVMLRIMIMMTVVVVVLIILMMMVVLVVVVVAMMRLVVTVVVVTIICIVLALSLWVNKLLHPGFPLPYSVHARLMPQFSDHRGEQSRNLHRSIPLFIF